MKKILIIMTFFSFLLVMSSCRSLDYADKYENVKWTCIDPEIEFTVINKLDEFHEGTLKVNGETIDILCCWSLTNSLVIYYKSEMDFEATGISEDLIRLSGKYKIKKGVVTLTITKDEIYNNKYEKMTFRMSDL